MVNINGTAYNIGDLLPVIGVYLVFSLIAGGAIAVLTGYSHVGFISAVACGMIGLIAANALAQTFQIQIYTLGFGSISVDIGLSIIAGLIMIWVSRLLFGRGRR